MVWDNSNAGIHPDGYCLTFANAYICGSTTYNVPPNFQGGQWTDLTPITVHPTGATVQIGLNPILLSHR